MTEEDLKAVEMEASAFRASELAAAAPYQFIPREPRAARAAAAKKPLRDLDSDEELSDLLASSDEEGGAGYQSESEPDEKIEKITHCALAHEVDAEELERHGTQAAIDAGEGASRAKKRRRAPKKPPSVGAKRRSSKAGDPSGVYLFCVKWEGCSYRRRSWETEEDVKAAYKAASSCRASSAGWGKDLDACEAFPSDYLVVDRVLDSREDLPAEEGTTRTRRRTRRRTRGRRRRTIPRG